MTISITRQRAVVLLTSVALTLALLFVVIAGGGDAADASVGGEQATTTHLVRTGDTLWDIAAATAEPGSDLRNVVEDIKRANDLASSLIFPGQVLVVPLNG